MTTLDADDKMASNHYFKNFKVGNKSLMDNYEDRAESIDRYEKSLLQKPILMNDKKGLHSKKMSTDAAMLGLVKCGQGRGGLQYRDLSERKKPVYSNEGRGHSGVHSKDAMGNNMISGYLQSPFDNRRDSEN